MILQMQVLCLWKLIDSSCDEKNGDKMTEIIGAQQFDGSWTEEVMQFLDTNDIQNQKMAELTIKVIISLIFFFNISIFLFVDQWPFDRVSFFTTFVIWWLETNFPQEKTVWNLVVIKAVQFLKTKSIDLDQASTLVINGMT